MYIFNYYIIIGFKFPKWTFFSAKWFRCEYANGIARRQPFGHWRTFRIFPYTCLGVKAGALGPFVSVIQILSYPTVVDWKVSFSSTLVADSSYLHSIFYWLIRPIHIKETWKYGDAITTSHHCFIHLHAISYRHKYYCNKYCKSVYIEVFADIISCAVGIGVHFLMSFTETLRTRKVRRRFPCSLFLRPKLWNFSWLLITGHACHQLCCCMFFAKSSETGMQKATRWPCPRGRWNRGRPHSACRGVFFKLDLTVRRTCWDERLRFLSPKSGFRVRSSMRGFWHTSRP